MNETTRDRARPFVEAADAAGVAANARITGTMGATLFVLFAAEGLTILGHVGVCFPPTSSSA